jgi:hypothetical protein
MFDVSHFLTTMKQEAYNEAYFRNGEFPLRNKSMLTSHTSQKRRAIEGILETI